MKKILSLMLALLMLALPVLSVAETAADGGIEIPMTAIAAERFSAKYLAEGQRLTADIQVQAGDVLLQNVPEDIRQGVKELLDALTIQVTGQSADGDRQGTLRVLLNGEAAADATIAKGKAGAYVASSFLGDKIVRVTSEQLKAVAEMIGQRMIAQGTITQEEMDAVRSALEGFRSDPEGFMAKLVGDANPTALLIAAMTLVEMEGEIQPVTELPEDVTIDAKYTMAAAVRKEALTTLMNELAKFLWSMPVVQRMAPNTTLNGQPLTEESLTGTLRSIADVFADDIVFQLYFTEDGSTVQALSDIRIQDGTDEVLEKINVLSETLETATHVVWSARSTKAEQAVNVNGEMTMVLTEEGGAMLYQMTADVKEGETEYTPIREDIAADWTALETGRTMTMKANMHVLPAPDSEEVGVVFDLQSAELDLGDHAETSVAVSARVEDLGELFTAVVNASTGLAEAYIITEDAIQPLAMSQEEQQAFLGEVYMSYVQGLQKLILSLPEALQNLILGNAE